MLPKNPFKMGRFLAMSKDLVVTHPSGTKSDSWYGPFNWQSQKGAEQLLGNDWRVPSFGELWLIGQLGELGVGGLSTELIEDDRYAKASGYWSSTLHTSRIEKYAWVMQVGDASQTQPGNGIKEIDEVLEPMGMNPYRLRLVKDIRFNL